jgi:hypothetical protein
LGEVTEEMRSVRVTIGEVSREVRLSHMRFPNGGGWSFFICPSCGRQARVLKLFEKIACKRCTGFDGSPLPYRVELGDKSGRIARLRARLQGGPARVKPRPGRTIDDEDVRETGTKAKPLPLSDFIAFSPDHSYIYRPDGEVWSATAVNASVLPIVRPPRRPLAASTWLDRNDAVEERTWAPGEPQIIGKPAGGRRRILRQEGRSRVQPLSSARDHPRD